jgi:hypothetical protein
VIDLDHGAHDAARIVRGLTLHQPGDIAQRAGVFDVRVGLEAQRDRLPQRDLAHVRLVDLTARAHAIECRRFEDAFAAPDGIPHLLLLVVPVADVDHGAAAGRGHGQPGQRCLDLGDALLGLVLAKLQRCEVVLVLLPGGLGLGLLVLELLLGQLVVEPGELQLERARELCRALRLELGLAQLAARLGDAQLLVSAGQRCVRALFADLCRHRGALVLFLLELAGQLGGVEAERRLALFDGHALGRHARDLELTDPGHQRRTERIGIDRL